MIEKTGPLSPEMENMKLRNEFKKPARFSICKDNCQGKLLLHENFVNSVSVSVCNPKAITIKPFPRIVLALCRTTSAAEAT